MGALPGETESKIPGRSDPAGTLPARESARRNTPGLDSLREAASLAVLPEARRDPDRAGQPFGIVAHMIPDLALQRNADLATSPEDEGPIICEARRSRIAFSAVS
jgi:hypothetical protein